MAEAYRFNGPVPEAVKQLRDRRRFRGSQLYETVKRGRRWDAEARRSLPTLPECASGPLGLTGFVASPLARPSQFPPEA